MVELKLSLLNADEYSLIAGSRTNVFHSPEVCRKLEKIIKKLGGNLKACNRTEKKIYERWKDAVFLVVVPEGEESHGNWDRRGKVKIEGVFRGDLRSRDEIIVSRSGLAVGDFCASSLICSGRIEGNILSSGKVLLNPGSFVTGKISAPSILIQEGAKFDGVCKILSDKKSEPFSLVNWRFFPEETHLTQK